MLGVETLIRDFTWASVVATDGVRGPGASGQSALAAVEKAGGKKPCALLGSIKRCWKFYVLLYSVCERKERGRECIHTRESA